MCGLVCGEDDERLSAHAEVHDGAIFLAPVVEFQPLQALGELVDVSDEGGGLGAWGEGEGGLFEQGEDQAGNHEGAESTEKIGRNSGHCCR